MYTRDLCNFPAAYNTIVYNDTGMVRAAWALYSIIRTCLSDVQTYGQTCLQPGPQQQSPKNTMIVCKLVSVLPVQPA